MSSILQSIGDFYANQLIPQDAHYLRDLYEKIAKNSQVKVTGLGSFASSVAIPRIILAPLTIPTALMYSANYTVRSVFVFGLDVVDGCPLQACWKLASNLLSAVRCTAVAVASVAYAVFGLVIGESLYSKILPRNPEQPVDLNEQIEILKNGKRDAFENISALEDILVEMSKKMDVLVKEIAEERVKQKKSQQTLSQEQSCLVSLKDKVKGLEESLKKSEGFEELLIKEKDNYQLLQNEIDDIYKNYPNIKKQYETVLVDVKDSKEELNSNSSDRNPVRNVDVDKEEENEFQIIDFDDSKLNAKSEKEEPSYLNQTSLAVMSKTQEIYKNLLVDGRAEWKDKRYATALSQLTAFPEFDKIVDSFKGIPNRQDKVQKALIDSFYQASSALSDTHKPVRERKKDFLLEFRKVLNLLKQHPAEFSVDLAKNFNTLCMKWITSIEMASFGYEITTEVAAQGKGVLNSDLTQEPLKKIFTTLLEGIDNAGPEFKAPTINQELKKVLALLSTYDPQMADNIANKICVATYERPSSNGSELRHVHTYRTGVPVCPRTSGEKESWELEGESVSLTPEFMGFLDYLVSENKMGLFVLHLSPAYYDTVKDKLNVMERIMPAANEGWWDFGVRHLTNAVINVKEYIEDSVVLQKKEANWIYLLRHVAKDKKYSKNVRVVLIPEDGEWLDKIHSQDKIAVSQLKLHLQDTVCKEGSPFILPDMEKQEKEKLVVEILDRIEKQYIACLPNKELLDNQAKEAFTALFRSQLIEALQLQVKADYVQRNCKDAVDRTMVLVGAQLMDGSNRLGQLHNKDNLKNIVGTVCSPALGVMKRSILNHRRPALEGTAGHFDELKKNKVVIENVPVYDGFMLKSLEIK